MLGGVHSSPWFEDEEAGPGMTLLPGALRQSCNLPSTVLDLDGTSVHFGLLASWGCRKARRARFREGETERASFE